MRNSLLYFGISIIILLSCHKASTSNPVANSYDGLWKIQVLELGCGSSQPQNTLVTAGIFSVDTFGIICTPLVNYTFVIAGEINTSGMVSGTLTSSNYGPPPSVPFSGNCPLPDSCSAEGLGIVITLTK